MSHHRVLMKDVHFAYADGRQALSGIDFSIRYGESVGLVGPNGAGKSTILLHLVGLLFPTQGTITVGDCRVTRDTLAEVRQSAGLVFQDPDDQLFMPTVGEDVAFGPLNQDLPLDQVERRVAEALDQVGGADLANRPPHRLSGGERRVAALATVLALAPEILLLDEPSAGLDPASRRRLITILGSLDQTRIIASHDLDLVLDVCDRTLVVHNGRIIADGPTERLLSNPGLLARARLELPLRLQGWTGRGDQHGTLSD